MKKVDFNSYEQGRLDGIKQVTKINWFGIMLSLLITLVITGLVIYPLWEDLPKKVCTETITHENFTLSLSGVYYLHGNMKIYEKKEVSKYLCTDGVTIYEIDDKIFFYYKIPSWIGNLVMSDYRDQTCIVQLKKKECIIK